MATEPPSEETTKQPTEKPYLPIEGKQPSEEEKVFHCSICGSELTPVETPTGTRYRCSQCAKLVKPIEKEERRGEEEKGVAPTEVEARKFVVRQLRERLDSVYGVSAKKVGPIADMVEENPQIALNPTALYWHIKQLAGQANDYQLYLFISGLFNKLRENRLLPVSQTPWPVIGMTGQTQQPAQFPPMFPQQQQPFNPFMPFPQPFQQPGTPQTPQQFEEYSEQRVRARRREQREEEEHKLRMAKIEAEIKAMSQPKQQDSNMVTIVEPMRDAEGNLIKDDKGKLVFRKITGPREQVQRTSADPEITLLNKMERYKKLFSSDLDETKIRAIIKEEIPKEKGVEVKPLTEKDVKDVAKEAAMNVVAATREEDKEERRHKELLDAISRSRSSEVVKGYTSDSYRFMGQGMDRLADVIEKKEPIKVIIQGAKDLVREERPPRKEVEAEAREGIFERVHPKFVTER